MGPESDASLRKAKALGAVGVMTTGTYALHERMPTQIFLIGGGLLLLLLAGLWILVSTRTVYHLWSTMRALPDEIVSRWAPPA